MCSKENSAYNNYSIMILIADQTGAYQCNLTNDAIKNYLGKKAINLENYEDVQINLKKLIYSKFEFKIILNENTYDTGDQAYNANIVNLQKLEFDYYEQFLKRSIVRRRGYAISLVTNISGYQYPVHRTLVTLVSCPFQQILSLQEVNLSTS